MFGTQTRFVAAVAAVLICSVACVHAADMITANFVETYSGKTNITDSGSLWYWYEGDNSRLRMNYNNLVGISGVWKLWHYPESAIYSVCPSKCTGMRTGEKADPWYFDSNVYYQSGSEGGYTWYTRHASSNAQVRRILMNGGDIKKIEFVDGRILALSSVAHPGGYSAGHSIFAKPGNCPQATCPLYADIIFVLDNSGSVDNGEWRQTADFVNSMMDQFTFGANEVEAAVVQFNGQKANQECSYGKVAGCWKCKTDWTYRSDSYPGPNTASIMAGRDYGGGMTVSADKASLKATMNGGRVNSWGNTCQQYGLDLALTMFARSPRQSYSNKPHKIIIAVTDGVEMCPNRTADAAQRVKNSGVFLIEVGVGMSSGCDNYDKKYLHRISSNLGSSSSPAYFDVSGYSSIKSIIDKMFPHLCENGFKTDCNPGCRNFCACGQCVCTQCPATKSSCTTIGCRTDGVTSNGCPLTAQPCPVADTVCRTWKCSKPSISGNDRCTYTDNPCTAKKNANPGKCREVYCSTSVSGGCYMQPNHNYCQKTHGNACLTYGCTPEGQTPQIASSGCRLTGNKTNDKQNELIKNGKSVCFKATCNPQTGITGEQDICVNPNPNCYTYTCEAVNGKYQCVRRDKNRPPDTKCTAYECKAAGWTPKTILTKEQCITSFGGAATMKCHKVWCDDVIGCTKQEIKGCVGNCTSEKIQQCLAGSKTYSTTQNCVLGACISVPDAQTGYKLDCDFKSNVVNCLQTMAAEVKKMNELFPDKCYTPVCNDDGTCGYTTVAIPASFVRTKCMEPKCRQQSGGTWNWAYEPTDVNKTCKTDACAFRECRNDDPNAPTGCYEQDKCMVKSTECVTYSCVPASGKNPAVCKETKVEMKNDECSYEVCENDKKVLRVKNLTEACWNYIKDNKCLVPICMDGKCQTLPKEAPEYDKCHNFDCNPATGDFSKSPKCDDGQYCTIDICDIESGECTYQAVICSDEIEMEGYPCFEARCREDPNDENGDGKQYKCMRKLIRNAYIDVCGNCIVDKPTPVVTVSSSGSSAFGSGSGSGSGSGAPTTRGASDSGSGSASSSASTSPSGSHSGAPIDDGHSTSSASVDLLECTGAPPRPILIEGLAASSIGLIIIAAIVGGIGITASGIITTKTLIDRARQANNQSAHSNPLYQNNEAEMNNPAFCEAA